MWDALFRAIGISSIPAGFMRRRGLQEPKKVAIEHNRLYAFLGLIIHSIPVGVACALVMLNMKGHLFGFFVVDSLESSSHWIPALLQAAKLHDLCMLASLTNLVFSVMCSELCCRNGLPYGAVFSGFQVRQPSFVWSLETWGLLKSDEIAKLHKAKLALIVFGAGILSFFVGPASGGLMLPRLRLSTVGSTPFWLNASDSSLFPSTLNDTLVRTSCANITGLPSLNTCPSSGWESLAGFGSLSSAYGQRGPPGSNWEQISAQPFVNSRPSANVINLLGSHATRSMYQTVNKVQGLLIMTTQHAALAEALITISKRWTVITQSLKKNAYLAAASSHAVSAWQPYAGVYCTSNHSIHNASDTRPLPFTKYYLDVNGSDLMTMNRSRLSQTQGTAKMPSLLFVDLDDLQWSEPDLIDVAVGAVIMDSNQSFSTCIVHAGWVRTYLNISTGSVESPSNISAMPSRGIKIPPSWAKYLNPITDNSGNRVFGWLTSFFRGDQNQYMAQLDPAQQFNGESLLSRGYEIILAALVTNGLANIFIDATLQGDLVGAASCVAGIRRDHCDWSGLYSDFAYFKEPSQAKSLNWTGWQVRHSVHGLTYSSEGIIIKFYMVVLLIYAAVITLFSAYSHAKGQTSYPWRSVSELTTLALVSPQPDKGLRDFHSTSAGIYGLNVFGKNVRVAAVNKKKGAEIGREELQLVFGKTMPRGYKKLVPNTEYGAVL